VLHFGKACRCRVHGVPGTIWESTIAIWVYGVRRMGFQLALILQIDFVMQWLYLSAITTYPGWLVLHERAGDEHQAADPAC
jgi:hypothetical protein